MSIDDNQLHREGSLDNYTSENVSAISNCLLGEYDEQGNYVISDLIKEELVKLTKYKKTTFNNSVFCVVNRPGIGEMVFKIDYEKNTKDNIAKATMYILENLYKVNGYLQETIKTKVAEFTGDLQGFIENSYEHFHVTVRWDDDDADVKEKKFADDPSTFAYISAQKQFQSALDKLTSEKYNKIYEKYFSEKLRILNGLGNEFSRAVLDEFRLEYAKVEKFFLTGKDYKALSELLDVCVEKHTLGKTPVTPQEQTRVAQEKEYVKKLTPVIKKFHDEAERIRDNAVDNAIRHLNKDEKVHVNDILKGKEATAVTTGPVVKEPKVVVKEVPKEVVVEKKPTTQVYERDNGGESSSYLEIMARWQEIKRQEKVHQKQNDTGIYVEEPETFAGQGHNGVGIKDLDNKDSGINRGDENKVKNAVEKNKNKTIQPENPDINLIIDLTK